MALAEYAVELVTFVMFDDGDEGEECCWLLRSQERAGRRRRTVGRDWGSGRA